MKTEERLGYITPEQEQETVKIPRHCVLGRVPGPCNTDVEVMDGSISKGEDPFKKLWCPRCGSIPWEHTAPGPAPKKEVPTIVDWEAAYWKLHKAATELDVHKISCNIRLCDCGKVKEA